MTDTTALPPPRTYPQKGSPEASAWGKMMRDKRLEKRKAREAMQAVQPILDYTEPEHLGPDASRELLPRILADEVAFRSELLARLRKAENALLTAVDKGLYSIDKASLPQIAMALCKVVELGERIVEKTKALDLTGTSRDQVAGLFAKYALLRSELQARGLMDTSGKLRTPTGTDEPAGTEDARGVEASESEASAAVVTLPEGV